MTTYRTAVAGSGSTTGLFSSAIKAGLFCLLICGAGLGYVWHKRQIDEFGQLIKREELKLEELLRHNKNRADAIQQLMSPRLLDQKAMAQFPELKAPQAQQVVALWEPKATAVRELPAPAATPAPVPVAGVRQIARANTR